MRDIAKTNHLPLTRNLLINSLKDRNQFLHKSKTFLKEQLAITGHLLFPYIKQGQIRLLLHFQKSITLLESLIIIS